MRSGIPCRTISMGGQAPCYGTEIDLLLKDQIVTRIQHGLPVDSDILRELLLVLLKAKNKEHLLVENGGQNCFLRGWSQRFFLRHHMPVRVVTTKMRDNPEDFLAKRFEYENVLTMAIARFKVPKELVVNMDETNVQFVPHGKRTRGLKGAKRIKLLGVGKDRAQITCGLAVVESGDVLPAQYIFGGKTDRCHPKVLPTDGSYFSHTVSHWQTPPTFLKWIDVILLPWKKKQIELLNLPTSQKMILKIDLHYSHKDKDVLQHLEANNIVPVFIPGGCTNELQELDVAVNKLFKDAVRKAFRDYCHRSFNHWINVLENTPETFVFNLRMSALKPKMTSYVTRGLLALQTPEMRKAIQDSFSGAGRLEVCRSPERLVVARAASQEDERSIVLSDEEELEDDLTGDDEEEDDDDLIPEEPSATREELVAPPPVVAAAVGENRQQLQRRLPIVPAATTTTVTTTTVTADAAAAAAAAVILPPPPPTTTASSLVFASSFTRKVLQKPVDGERYPCGCGCESSFENNMKKCRGCQLVYIHSLGTHCPSWKCSSCNV